MATLRQQASEPRFFSGVEICMMHCAVCPVLLPRDARQQMRILGNSLAVPQALQCLARAMSLIRYPGDDSLLQRLMDLCLDIRIHCRNYIVLPCDMGWVLCRKDQALSLAARLPSQCPWGQLRPPEEALLMSHWCADELQGVHFALPPGISLIAVLNAFGLDLPPDYAPHAAHGVCPSRTSMLPTQPQDGVLEVPVLPTIDLSGRMHPAVPPDEQPFLLIIGRHTYYVLPSDGPTLVGFLNQVVQLEAGDQPAAEAYPVWRTLSGMALHSWRALRGVVSLRHALAWDHCAPPAFQAQTLQHCRLLSASSPVRFHVAEPWDSQLVGTFPVSSFEAIGWCTVFCPTCVPCPGTTCMLHTSQARLAVTEPQLLARLAEMLLQGVLEAAVSDCEVRKGKITVKVQIAGRNLWQGPLPGHLTFQWILEIWQQARRACGLTRIYSGPIPSTPCLTLAQAFAEPYRQGFVGHRGVLLATLHPELKGGGGAKEAKYSSMQSALAQALLDQGLNLPDTSTVVDKLLPRAGLARVTRVMGLSSADQRWSELQEMCKQFDVQLPPTTAKLEKAAKKVQAAFRKKQSADPSRRLPASGGIFPLC